MRFRRYLTRLLITLAVLYTASIALLAYHETSLVYAPFRPPANLALYYPGFTLKHLPNEDGAPIAYWENAPRDPHAPLILYFHGNGGLQRTHLLPLAAYGFHVIAMEYPGYPGVPGTPSEPLLVAQGRALHAHFAQQYPAIPLVLWGYSLGTGIATQLAAARSSTALILEAPFTAVVDRAAELYPFAPIRLIMRNTYRSRDFIGQVHCPLLMLHGEGDQIIPIRHGQALFALANQPKTFKRYHNAGHLDLDAYGAYDDAASFIRQQASPQPSIDAAPKLQ